MRARRIQVAAAVTILALATPCAWAATTGPGQRATARTHTTLAGAAMPPTLGAYWDRVRATGGRLTVAGANVPLTVSQADGRLRLAGPRPAGPLCVSRKYTAQGTAQPVVGTYANTVRVRRADGSGARVAEASDRYLGSPPGVVYEVDWSMEVQLPRLREGDAAVWAFATAFTEPVADYREQIRVRRSGCPD